MAEGKLHASWLADLIHAQMARGHFGKMAEYAIAQARSWKQQEYVDLFINMRDQVADYYSQSGDGTINVRIGK